MSTCSSFGFNFSRIFGILFRFLLDNFRVSVRVRGLDLVFSRNLLEFFLKFGVSLLKLLFTLSLPGDVFSK